MTLETNHPEYKTLLYQLVNFLISKKLSKEGVGVKRPMGIPLKDFSALLSYAESDDGKQAEIKKLKLELQGIAGEEDKSGESILKINNPDIFDDFSDNFDSNKKIILVYSRKALEKYKSDLFDGDAIITNKDKLIFDADKQEFKLNNKTITINKSEKNIRANLCLLMYGYKNLGIDRNQYTIKEYAERFQDWSSYNDYSPGDDVELDLLKLMLLGIEENINNSGELEDRQVTDAIRGINERAEKGLQREIFSHSNRTIKLLNP